NDECTEFAVAKNDGCRGAGEPGMWANGSMRVVGPDGSLRVESGHRWPGLPERQGCVWSGGGPACGQATPEAVDDDEFGFAREGVGFDHGPGLAQGDEPELADFAILVFGLDRVGQDAIADEHVLDLVSLGQTAVHAKDHAQR